jgi:proton glutamate symport protein
MAEHEKKEKKGFLDFLLSPWSVLGGAAAGCVIGVYFKGFAEKIDIIGDLFIAFLMMCTLPIILSGVVGSLGRMFHSGKMGREVKRLAFLVLLAAFISATVTFLAGLIIQPGATMSESAKTALCTLAAADQPGDGEAAEISGGTNKGGSFLKSLIPSNIFDALSRGSIMGVLFFSVLLGVSIGIQRTSTGETIINIMDSVFNACQQIMEWGMYALPAGLCCLIAPEISKMGLKIFFAMAGYLGLCYIAALVVIVLNGFIIAKASGVSYFRTFKALQSALVIAFATGNSFAAIPASLLGLQQKLKFDPDRTNLVIPFGATLSNPGSIIYIVATTVFFCYIYNVSPVANYAWAVIIFGSVLVSFGTAGGGTVVYVLMGVIFDQLDIPLQTAVPLLLAVDYFIDPILTVVDTHVNCMIAAIMSDLSVRDSDAASVPGGAIQPLRESEITKPPC